MKKTVFGLLIVCLGLLTAPLVRAAGIDEEDYIQGDQLRALVVDMTWYGRSIEGAYDWIEYYSPDGDAFYLDDQGFLPGTWEIIGEREICFDYPALGQFCFAAYETPQGQVAIYDLNDDSLEETPHRIAKMYVDEVFSGLDYSQFPKITVIENKMNVEEMVCVDKIDLTSTCEHHFVTIDGFAKVAYIPKQKVIGLSKINRLVRFFAQRPQVQERLTQQVLVALQTLLGTEDVAVTMTAVHYCVKARGVKDGNSTTRTTSLGGVFKTDPASRAEFLS